MSPLKYQDSVVTRGVINGPRPFSLRISKDTQVIHKPPPSAAGAKQTAAAAKRPVIIYTHSPKVIHTQPNDFMTLVQKLTGMSREDNDDSVAFAAAVPPPADPEREEEDGGIVINNVGQFDEGNETTSLVITDDHGTAAAVVSPMYKMLGAFLVEAPLFTPSSSELFCSPLSGSMFHQSPGMAAMAISSSFMDYMKAFPDY